MPLNLKAFLLLLDGYSRIVRYNYIPSDLCNIIASFLIKGQWSFFIIFEKSQGSDITEILCYDLKTKKQEAVSKDLNNLNYSYGQSYSIYKATDNYYIFRVGHGLGGQEQNQNMVYDYNENNKVTLPKTLQRRLYSRSLFVEDLGLLCVAGFEQQTVELLPIDIQDLHDENNAMKIEWQYFKSLNHVRSKPSIVLLTENIIFVSSGIASCEMYDLNDSDSHRDRTWKQIESLMKYSHYESGITQWKQKDNNVIVVGGNDPVTSRKVEEYNLIKNEWYELPETIESHLRNPCLVVEDGILYVVGNEGTQRNSNGFGCIEFYDVRVDKWQVQDQLVNVLHFNQMDCKDRIFEYILS